ncbi:MAG: DUF4384 domain-containing protein [Syntrophobacterales bacterium]
MKRLLLSLFVLFALGVFIKWSEAQETSKHPASPPLSFDINYVYRQSALGELKPIKSGDVLHSGDHYKIIFTPDKDCYVYIFQVDSTGHFFQLFPMKSFRGVRVDNTNPVMQGTTYTLPRSDKAFMLDRQVGVERIYFIASNERNQELENLYRDWQGATTRKQPKQAENAKDKLNKYFKKRGIVVVAPSDESLRVSWEESGEAFSVVNQRLEELSEDNMHVLQFFHR